MGNEVIFFFYEDVREALRRSGEKAVDVKTNKQEQIKVDEIVENEEREEVKEVRQMTIISDIKRKGMSCQFREVVMMDYSGREKDVEKYEAKIAAPLGG